MVDPSAALVELDGLLSLASTTSLDATRSRRLAALVAEVPGRARQVARALAAQADPNAVDALLTLPPDTPGLVEGLFHALRRGVTRPRPDGQRCPRMLALEFRSSRARSFAPLLTRACAAFGPELERLRVGKELRYRVALFAEPDAPAALQARARAMELDLEAIHRDLARLRGVRLWLNGWCFDDQGPLRPRTRAPLLHAWFEWARAPSP